MPTPPVTDELAQEALDLIELHGSGAKASKAIGGRIHKDTLRHRCYIATIRGMKPTVKKDAPRIHSRERLGRMHIVIPDCQVRPGVSTDHLEHIGNYVAEKKPDELICIGDFWDFPSIGEYDRGKLKGEGQRYNKDVRAGNEAMDRLMAPIAAEWVRNPWPLRKTFTIGNHEERGLRYVNTRPELEGKIDVLEDINLKKWDWDVHPYLEVVKIDGIEYSHFFTSGVRGKPVSSAAALLRERQGAATMGHVQFTDMAIHKKTQRIALFCGICYTHNEGYLGPQDNGQRRQIIVKHEVNDGHYDPMFVSLGFLKKAYS